MDKNQSMIIRKQKINPCQSVQSVDQKTEYSLSKFCNMTFFFVHEFHGLSQINRKSIHADLCNQLTKKNISKFRKMTLTLVVKKGKNGFLIGQLKEVPEVFTQGLTLEEVKENIIDSLEMYLEDLRERYQPEGEMLQEEELIFA